MTTMKSSDIFRYTSEKLSASYSPGEAKALSRVVIEDIIGYSFTKALADLEPELDEHKKEMLDNVIRRLQKHEPIQYILGKTTFCNHDFLVTPDVLIPRPETETLVETAIKLDLDTNARIMDACTGSGCIAISIKLAQPTWHVEACDISEPALALAKKNAAKNNADVDFYNINVLSEELPYGPYDIIVSNPPYVMNSEKCSMESNVLEHEPHLALFVEDNNPLVFYNALANWGKRALAPKGELLVEINHLLAAETRELFEKMQYACIRIIKDCFGKDRFILCQK